MHKFRYNVQHIMSTSLYRRRAGYNREWDGGRAGKLYFADKQRFFSF